MSYRGTNYLGVPTIAVDLEAKEVEAAGSVVATYVAQKNGFIQISCNLQVHDVPANAVQVWVCVADDGDVANLAPIPSTEDNPCSELNSQTANIVWVLKCEIGKMYAVMVETEADTVVDSGFVVFHML